ncbi:YncE family protein [Lampropedia puyangensis]|uniref:YncE family protein n=1 Tax=Lampropedia puyangensis TaxID=1330072 RepID=A0A4S8FD60_9BURK|nr:YncE family protein [Lampropedia puyangensis]THU05091.1 YncE family protein [Lampropedia puyangensis]
MTFSISHTLSAVACAVLLAGCQSTPTQTPQSSNASTTSNTSATLANAPVLRQDTFDGVYEITATADGGSLFVASVTGFDPQNGGFVHRLDARTLQTVQTVQVPRRAFALGLNNATNTLYVGNTMEGSLSVVDARSGTFKGLIQLAEPKQNDKGQTVYAHTRKVIVDEVHNRVFVTSPGRPGLIWIVDGATNTLTHTITSDGIWSAGAAYDAERNRLYIGQGGENEVLVINPDRGTVVQQLSTGEMTEAHKGRSANFFINIALDAQGQRLFAAGGQKNQVYVWDLASGQVIQRIPFSTSTLDILYNSARNEVVTSHRGDDKTGTGFVSILDGTTFAIKRTIDLPVHPNSLALSPNGQTLYVTVKAPHGDKHPAFRKDAKDGVVRIDL